MLMMTKLPDCAGVGRRNEACGCSLQWIAVVRSKIEIFESNY